MWLTLSHSHTGAQRRARKPRKAAPAQKSPSDRLRTVAGLWIGRSNRARRARREPCRRHSRSARPLLACSFVAGTATRRPPVSSWPEKCLLTTHSCSVTWQAQSSRSSPRSPAASGSACTGTTTQTASARRRWLFSSCASSAPTSAGTCRAASRRATASSARRLPGWPTKAAASCSPSTAVSRQCRRSPRLGR